MSLSDNLLDVLRNTEVGSTNWTLANAILNHGSQLQQISIQQLAEECHVSEPTVSRFAKHLNCRNYIDLKAQAASLGRESDSFLFHMDKASIQQLKNHPDRFMERYSHIIAESIQDDVQHFDYQKLDKLLEQIHLAERVFIFGTSTSLMFAEMIQSNLSNYQKIVYIALSQKQQLNHLNNLRKSDLVIVISTYGNYINRFPDFARRISEADCQAVLLTQNSGLQTLYFDDVILFSKQNNIETGTYSMIIGIEYLVRRYAVLFKP